MAFSERPKTDSQTFKREMYTPPLEKQKVDSSSFKREMYKPEPALGAEQLAARERVAESMRQIAFERVQSVAKLLSETELSSVTELVDSFEKLSEEKFNDNLSAEDYAVKKRDIFIEMNSIFDDALERVSKDDEPEKTEWVKNPVAEVKPGKASKGEQTPADPALEKHRQENEVAAAWDAQVGEWIRWANQAKLYDMDSDHPERVWRPETPSEELLKATGLTQEQFFELTAAMKRRKQASATPDSIAA